MEVAASLSQGRTAAAQCGLFTHKSVPVIFEPPCRYGRNAELSSCNRVKIHTLMKIQRIKYSNPVFVYISL